VPLIVAELGAERQRASRKLNDSAVRALRRQAPRLRRAATRLRGLGAHAG
jgi:hypothetical protein